jgi:hypothetical protein
MRLVLFIPDFVLADEPEVLRACPVRISADLCCRIAVAVERCHEGAEAPALPPFCVCADKDPTRRGLEAIPEAMAVGFFEPRNLGEVRLKVRAATGDGTHGIDEPMNTFVAPDDTYEGAIASNELRDAFLRHQKSPETTYYSKIRHEGLYGVLINLRLAARDITSRSQNTLHAMPGVGIESDQFEFAVGLPLYDAGGHVIDLRRYSVFSAIGRDGLKSAAELLKPLLR